MLKCIQGESIKSAVPPDLLYLQSLIGLNLLLNAQTRRTYSHERFQIAARKCYSYKLILRSSQPPPLSVSDLLYYFSLSMLFPVKLYVISDLLSTFFHNCPEDALNITLFPLFSTAYNFKGTFRRKTILQSLRDINTTICLHQNGIKCIPMFSPKLDCLLLPHYKQSRG